MTEPNHDSWANPRAPAGLGDARRACYRAIDTLNARRIRGDRDRDALLVSLLTFTAEELRKADQA